MSGYVASARIEPGPPRLARGERSWIVADEPTKPVESPAIVVEAVARDDPHPSPVVERLRAARERWSQLTFFLFDPNSWRT